MIKSRHRARVLALKALFEVDSSTHEPSQVIERLLAEENLAQDTKEFAQQLVHGVQRQKSGIDAIIQEQAPAWPLSQVSKIDRNILRLAIFEILFDNTTPTKAAINEAVELAKAFGGDSSSSFVNGVLGGVVRKWQEGKAPAKLERSTTK